MSAQPWKEVLIFEHMQQRRNFPTAIPNSGQYIERKGKKKKAPVSKDTVTLCLDIQIGYNEYTCASSCSTFPLTLQHDRKSACVFLLQPKGKLSDQQEGGKKSPNTGKCTLKNITDIRKWYQFSHRKILSNESGKQRKYPNLFAYSIENGRPFQGGE